MLEKGVTNESLLAMSQRGSRLFRNNVGNGWQGDVTKLADGSILIRNPRLVRFGLCEGSSDYIGWTPVPITDAMIGHRLAVFTAPEMKRSQGGRKGDLQINFINQVRLAGGIAGFVNSVETAMQLYTQIPGRPDAS